MNNQKQSKRLRRDRNTIQEVRKTLVNLLRESINKDDRITFSDIQAIFNEFGLTNLSAPSIRRDLKTVGIEYNGQEYILKGIRPAQNSSLELSRLIKDFDIFEPVVSQKLKPQNFTSLTLIQIYLRLKPDVQPERLLQFKDLLQQYLNQVHNLYLETPCDYPLERYFFDINISNQTICFLLNGKDSLDIFYDLLTEIKECNPDTSKSKNRVKLFHIIPE